MESGDKDHKEVPEYISMKIIDIIAVQKIYVSFMKKKCNYFPGKYLNIS